jgi:hypothetical protein
VRSVVVVLRREHAAATLDQVAVSLDNHRIAARFERTEADRSFLFYDVGDVCHDARILLQPSPGWRPDGVLGFSVALDALGQRAFAPADPANRSGLYEVEFR